MNKKPSTKTYTVEVWEQGDTSATSKPSPEVQNLLEEASSGSDYQLTIPGKVSEKSEDPRIKTFPDAEDKPEVLKQILSTREIDSEVHPEGVTEEKDSTALFLTCPPFDTFYERVAIEFAKEAPPLRFEEYFYLELFVWENRERPLVASFTIYNVPDLLTTIEKFRKAAP